MSDKQNASPDCGASDNAETIPSDDPHKTEKLTKQGRDDLDPDEGSD